MSGSVFLIVMLAAALHAGWNAVVKGGADKTASMTAVVLGQGLAGLVCLPFAAWPDPACLPWLIGSVGLHFGYQVFLLAAYRVGDLTQVYPIARGVAPLIVAVTAAAVLGEAPSPLQGAGIALIAGGIASFSLVRGAAAAAPAAAGLALVTGLFIAAYSLVDGTGARLAGTALGFYAWLAVAEGVWFAAVSPVMRRGLLGQALRLRRSLLIGGAASFTAYALVIYAFTQAPIALVTALRETSVVFALGIGVLALGERMTLPKILATAATLAGAALLRLAGG